ncbi:hypothetical protein niasHS_002194 [Heterodera schachtii]|uniref:Uncharacterized protein n=1 Tax=Heterodera schachtii TaxID=97005 RepID=A0ABD2KMI0_HETSC
MRFFSLRLSFPQISLPFSDFLPFPLLFVFSFFHFPPYSVALSDLANSRDSLPLANWVLLAEGNQTALTVDAFRQAKLADQKTQAKVERIERMMNSSIKHNEQILKNGVNALQRLAKDEKRTNGAKGGKSTGKTAIAMAMLLFVLALPFHLGAFAR